MSLHLELADLVAHEFQPRLARPPEHRQDALLIELDNGVSLVVRYAAPDAYSLRWTLDEAELGIDTAPLHRELSTFPNHLHDASGRTLPDPLTKPDDPPGENLLRVIRALLADPTLGRASA